MFVYSSCMIRAKKYSATDHVVSVQNNLTNQSIIYYIFMRVKVL